MQTPQAVLVPDPVFVSDKGTGSRQCRWSAFPLGKERSASAMQLRFASVTATVHRHNAARKPARDRDLPIFLMVMPVPTCSDWRRVPCAILQLLDRMAVDQGTEMR